MNNVLHLSDKTRRITNIVLSLIATGVILFYSLCTGSCAYLKGSIFSFDLKYIGIAYMAALVFCNVLKWDVLSLVLLSIGIGGEVYLVGFQVVHNTFCPFCLAFGVAIIVQFFLNFDWSRKWFIVTAVIAGLLCYLLFFKGTVTPNYDFGSLIGTGHDVGRSA